MYRVLVRPHSFAGYRSALTSDRDKSRSGLTYGSGGRILLPAGIAPYRYGLDVTWTDNYFFDDSLLRIGIALEAVMFKHFHAAIGTLGFIDLDGGGSHFGITTTLGYETTFNKNINIMVGMQNDLIFQDVTVNTMGLVVGIGYQFGRTLD